MLGTLASFLLVLGAAVLVGQAILLACGRADLSRLAPAVGLAVLFALAWWTVRLPGEGTAAAIAIGIAVLAAAAALRARAPGAAAPLAGGLAVAGAALALAALPFLVEGRFGILGTGLNPDMSQHLFAADRLGAGARERLIAEGYPLGPHSLALAVAALGPSTVQAFGGLTLALAVAACLAPLALLDGAAGWRRWAGALCVGLAYLVAAFLVQGAFKELAQALFVLAFAIALARLTRVTGAARDPRAGVAPGLLAVGSVYAYSFPGLAWLGGALAVWAAIELGRAARRRAAREVARAALPSVLAGLGLLLVAIAPEAGRMIQFASFETFDPAGPGLGNLFDRISPLEALGIWPSGDFRVEPGDGAVPAVVFYLGAALGLGALGFGLVWSRWRRQHAVPAALAAAAALWLVTLLAGTPYQEAKALVLLAPLVALVSVRALAMRRPALPAALVLLAAAGSSVLALANGPVGPSGYSPELAELRERLGGRSVVVLAPRELLADQHGLDYLVWELRGNRVCVEQLGERPPGASPPGALTLRVALDERGAVVPAALEPATGAATGAEPCPLIPDAARADPSAAEG